MLRRRGDRYTPHQLLYGITEPLSIKEFRVFGCDAWALVPDEKRGGKLAARSRPCIHLGYDHDRSAWIVLDPESGKVEYSRDVRFNERSFALCRKFAKEADGGDALDALPARGADEWEDIAFENEMRLVQQISADEQKKATAPGHDAAPDAAEEWADHTAQMPVGPAQREAAADEQRGDESGPDAENKEDAPRRSTRERKPVLRYGMVDQKDVAQGNAPRSCAPVPDDPRATGTARKHGRTTRPTQRRQLRSLPAPRRHHSILNPSRWACRRVMPKF